MTDLEADSYRLHEPAFRVTFTVANTGSVDGTEVRKTR